jgi:preprotein translocase subunit SecB
MSDDAAIPSNVGDTPPVDAVEQGSVPAMGIRAQYIKDLSFENPHAPGSLLQPEQPRIDVNVNVEAKPAGDLGYEVTLNIRADARSNERTAFVLELEYAGLFDLTRIPEAQRHAVCLIEAPRLLFPFARQIAAETTRSGGFPPMYLDPIDFGALYRNHLSQQQGTTQVADSATTPQAADARASES